MRRLMQYVRNFWWTADPSTAEFMSGITAIMWAVLLALPGDQFARDAYAKLAGVAPEEVWAGWFGFLGVIQAMRATDASERLTIRHDVLSGLAAITWLYVAAAFWLAQPGDAGSSIYWVIATAQMWAWLRSGSSGRRGVTDDGTGTDAGQPGPWGRGAGDPVQNLARPEVRPAGRRNGQGCGQVAGGTHHAAG